MYIDKGIIELQTKLQLSEGFFERLLEDEDWSFVIKLHALIESVCTSLILHHLNEPSLEKIISRLEISNTTTGKIAILKALGLIGDKDRRFIRSLSELRNSFVHDVRNCHASLIGIVETLNSQQLKQFALDFAPYAARQLDLQKLKIKGEAIISDPIDIVKLIDRAKQRPKIHIWFGAYNLLVSIVDMHGYSDYLQYEKARKYFETDEANE